MLFFSLSMASLVGCGDEPPAQSTSDELAVADEPVEADDADVLAASRFFPLSPGSRWRYQTPAGGRSEGVIGVDSSGRAILYGTGDSRPSYFRSDEASANRVSPTGEVLEVLLQAPLRLGATWSYTQGEGAAAVSCEVEVVDAQLEAQVEESRLGGCLKLERRCLHPAGGPFAVDTMRRALEVYCPAIGRVSSEITLTPPLEGVGAGAQVSRLIDYRVAGAPVLSPSLSPADCAHFILLASDVQAACGSQWRWISEDSLSDCSGCVHRFSAGDQELAVSLRVHRQPEQAEAAFNTRFEQASTLAGGVRHVSEPPAWGSLDGVYELGVSGSDVCTDSSMARLWPLLRSLLPPPPG